MEKELKEMEKILKNLNMDVSDVKEYVRDVIVDYLLSKNRR